MSKILMVASEAAPYAKTGGLSDVVSSLPRALKELGHEVVVLLPRYGETAAFRMRRIWDHLAVPLGPDVLDASVMQAEDDPTFLFLDIPELYSRAGLYGNAAGDFPDNHLRFAALARGALELSRRIFLPDIFHCHDWQAGLLPVYQRQLAGDPTFANIPTVTTIHNLGYQGFFPPSALPELGLDSGYFVPSGLEFYGQVNFLKAGLVFSDWLTTVSRRYAEEIQTPEFGFGLDGLLRARAARLTGILNGADYTRWNPETDPAIPANFSAQSMMGKRKCKTELLREFGLPDNPGTPLLGIVSRFTNQKGCDLIAAAAPRLFAEESFHLIALGSGETAYENLFRALAKQYPTRVGLEIGYDDALAHRIEAGSDMFLMPSLYEPCGLNQMYSLRYGTVPIVRATGGLDDTIDSETGYKFADYTADALRKAVRDAIAGFRNQKSWQKMISTGMSRDFSWGPSAREYDKLYRRLLNPAAL
jgi:starch synthase